MVAFHGDPAVKAKYLRRVAAHRKKDEIIQGLYWALGVTGRYHGCAVGCTIHGSDHKKYETELGIPRDVAFIEDTIFEYLPEGEAFKFPGQFLKAIKPGADLSNVSNKYVGWLKRQHKNSSEYPVDARDCLLRCLREAPVDWSQVKRRTKAKAKEVEEEYTASQLLGAVLQDEIETVNQERKEQHVTCGRR